MSRFKFSLLLLEYFPLPHAPRVSSDVSHGLPFLQNKVLTCHPMPYISCLWVPCWGSFPSLPFPKMMISSNIHWLFKKFRPQSSLPWYSCLRHWSWRDFLLFSTVWNSTQPWRSSSIPCLLISPCLLDCSQYFLSCSSRRISLCCGAKCWRRQTLSKVSLCGSTSDFKYDNAWLIISAWPWLIMPWICGWRCTYESFATWFS